ncbi:hypothetical protein [Sphingobacterium sp. Mn56C]
MLEKLASKLHHNKVLPLKRAITYQLQDNLQEIHADFQIPLVLFL